MVLLYLMALKGWFDLKDGFSRTRIHELKELFSLVDVDGSESDVYDALFESGRN